ncbi:MAG: type II toxin-antitoxin system HicA family toxin [Nitrosopumilus sp.]|nr:type II toxin-antitoxin system HicA family toxin [Nitrosopumilus sp.]
MSLPIIGWREILGALKHRGFYPVRQKGSHVVIENGFGLWTTVPRKDEIGKGLLLAIIKDCGLTKQEFLKLL